MSGDGRADTTPVSQSASDLFQGLFVYFTNKSPSGTGTMAPASGFPGLLSVIFFPSLPPPIQTLCYLCRVVAFLIIAPIAIVAAIDFAEYAVIRTLGLRRRKVRVKPHGSSSSRMQLSPAQLRRQTTLQSAPLLTPGAYDAETLLRHRARSISSASSEALEEWTRTNGSFARVAEVRAATSASASAQTSRMSSPPGGNTPSLRYGSDPEEIFSRARNDIGSDGALGLSESEPEGDDGSGLDSGPSSPVIYSRQGLKGSQFGFTPIDKRKKSDEGKTPSPTSPSSGTSSALPSSATNSYDREPLAGIDLGQMAAAADLERPSLLAQ